MWKPVQQATESMQQIRFQSWLPHGYGEGHMSLCVSQEFTTTLLLIKSIDLFRLSIQIMWWYPGEYFLSKVGTFTLARSTFNKNDKDSNLIHWLFFWAIQFRDVLLNSAVKASGIGVSANRTCFETSLNWIAQKKSLCAGYLGIVTWSLLGKQSRQAKKVDCSNKR